MWTPTGCPRRAPLHPPRRTHKTSAATRRRAHRNAGARSPGPCSPGAGRPEELAGDAAGRAAAAPAFACAQRAWSHYVRRASAAATRAPPRSSGGGFVVAKAGEGARACAAASCCQRGSVSSTSSPLGSTRLPIGDRPPRRRVAGEDTRRARDSRCGGSGAHTARARVDRRRRWSEARTHTCRVLGAGVCRAHALEQNPRTATSQSPAHWLALN